MDQPWLIAVHGGAGHHSTAPSSENAVKLALRTACNSAISELRDRKSDWDVVEAVERAICNLEDNECLNAGTGSNLTLDGHVECDASVMDGETNAFGSVGAVRGVKNPISLARKLMQNTTKPQPLGREPPLTLVGLGASAFATSSGLQLVNPEELITRNARREWEKWKTRFESATAHNSTSVPRLDGDSSSSIFEDTVGAVACNKLGAMAAGVSSGGLLLKAPGRIGEAAVFGAGVWAHSSPALATGVACSVSGTGEAIIRDAFARNLGEALYKSPSEAIHDIILSKFATFCNELTRPGEDPPSLGAIIVTKEPIEPDSDSDSDSDSDTSSNIDTSNMTEEYNDYLEQAYEDEKLAEYRELMGTTKPREYRTIGDEIERMETMGTRLRLWCAFTTQSMAIAYASSENEKPKSFILRRESKTEGRIYITALSLSK